MRGPDQTGIRFATLSVRAQMGGERFATCRLLEFHP